MASPLRIDPLGGFNFYITLVDTSDLAGTILSIGVNYAVAGFTECTGLDSVVEVMEVREGGLNDYTHKFPTRVTHGNITLRHGVLFLFDDFWRWQEGFQQGKGRRKDALVVLLDEARNPGKIWKIKRALPRTYIAPAFNAMQSNVAFQSLEIAHEGVVLQTGA